MIRKWNKNDDLVVNLRFNADSITYFRAEYYTDSAYKFVVEEFLEEDCKKYVFIPASELSKMNDGLLLSDVFYGYESEHFEDGSLDVRSHSNLDIYIYNESPSVNPDITKLSLLENDMGFITKDDIKEIEETLPLVINKLEDHQTSIESLEESITGITDEYATKQYVDTKLDGVDQLLNNLIYG